MRFIMLNNYHDQSLLRILINKAYSKKGRKYLDFINNKNINFSDQDKFYEKTKMRFPQNNLYDATLSYSTNEYIDRLLGNVKSKIILDLGSGMGIDTQRLIKKGAEVISLDSSEKALMISQIVNKNIHIRADATKLPFKDNSIDIVFGNDILHHIEERESLNEVKRVLKSGGFAIFKEPLKYNPIIFLYRIIKSSSRVPQHPFSPSYLEKVTRIIFKKTKSYFFYVLLPFFVFLLIYFPNYSQRISKLYINKFSNLDKKITKVLPFLSWVEIIKLYK